MPFSDGNFKNRTFANIKQEKGTGNIHFLINQGEGQTPLTKRDFTGRLKEVKIKIWEYQGKPKESLLFIFEDGDSEVWVECGWSIVSKNILNSLAGADAIGQVMIALYKNKKGYTASYVEVNGQKTEWKYSQEQLPKAEKKMVRGEEIFDDYDQIQFFKNTILPEINSKIQNEFLVEAEMKKPESQPQNGAKQKTGELVPDNLPDDLSDLPFHSPYNQKIPFMVRRTTAF